MSAIAGIVRLDSSPLQTDSIQRMVDILAHHGSDGAGVWVDGCVGLGHRMLWTTPESLAEKLPLRIGHNTITADARIDNRHDLSRHLNFGGRPASEISDSEIILAAYEKWGEDCAAHLVGDFAFAIWDESTQSLFCARDHLGLKPFYYVHQPHHLFAFASEIKALFTLPEVPRELYEERIADYLLVNFDERSTTFYKSVFRLPAAHRLRITAQQIRIEQYWQLNPTRELQLSSDDEYAEAFLECFTQVIQSRLRTAYPIGSFLSGGLDSSSIVCMARQLLERENTPHHRLHTFSAIFPNLPDADRAKADERPFIEKVLAGGGLESHFVAVDEHSPLESTAELLHRLDEPSISPNLFMHWAIYHSAQQAGVRILLDGFGGDSVISHGGMYLTELARSGQWQTFTREVQSLASHHRISPYLYLQSHALGYFAEMAHGGQWLSFLRNTQALARHFPISRTDWVLNHGIKPVLMRPYRRWKSDQHLSGEQITSDMTILNNDFISRIRYNNRQQNVIQSFPQTLREDQYAELNSSTIPLAIEELNKSAALMGFQTTFPYFDRRLIEFCLSVPSNQKLHDGWGRMYMRRALKGILPEEIRWRTSKGNLSPNFRRGFSQADWTIVESALEKAPDLLGDFVSIPQVQSAYDRYLSNRNDVDELVLWRIATLSLWMEKFVTQQGIRVNAPIT